MIQNRTFKCTKQPQSSLASYNWMTLQQSHLLISLQILIFNLQVCLNLKPFGFFPEVKTFKIVVFCIFS